MKLKEKQGEAPVMGLKKYYASDMPEALARIRAELGSGAVILDTQKLERGIEVIAMSESQLTGHVAAIAPQSSAQPGEDKHAPPGSRSDDSPIRHHSSQERADRLEKTEAFSLSLQHGYGQSASEGGASGFSERTLSSAAANYAAGVVTDSEEIHSELGNIRSMLQQWIGSNAWTDYSAQSPNQARLWEKFSAMGIDSQIIQGLIEPVGPEESLSSAWGMCLARLAQRLPTVTESLEEAGGIFAFVGATGAGKTSTIGKLAARHVLNKGADSIALISTDKYRVAAQEQLNTLGKILGVGVYSVQGEQELNATLELLEDKQLVLIDTAGLTRKGRNNASQRQSLLALSRSEFEIKPVLVLSATSQRQVSLNEIELCRELRPCAVVISKTDEAASLGEVLSAVIRAELPLAYETCGQDIPADINLAKSHQLVSKAVAIATGSEIDHCDFLATFAEGQHLGMSTRKMEKHISGTFA